MDIKKAHFALNGRSKSERLAIPYFTECELRISIGEFGFADIAIWQKAGNGPQEGDFGRMAGLMLYSPSEMRKLGEALLKLADAADAMKGSNALAQADAACGVSPGAMG